MKPERDDLKLYYRTTFDTPEGKLVLKDILTECYFFDEFHPNDKDAAGKRSIGIGIMHMLGSEDAEITKEAIIDGVLKTPSIMPTNNNEN